ncbi:MAG: EAL domain-containing protein [Planctomycetes bacterium]|nr:EAL domain-containing protein [Planctomycetota bacterium]MCB9934323.1 EAL domain-containing protein [Planctomycetota bacterium]
MVTPKVLIIEDDPGVAKLVSNAVAKVECEPVTVDTGTQAVQWLLDYSADLLLIDNILPDMRALDLLDQLEKNGKSFPFIITTGQGNESLAVELMKRGAVDYIVKDTDFLDRLPSALARALEMIRTKRRLSEIEASLLQFTIETEAILEAAADGIVTFDHGGRIVTANAAICEMYGFSAENLIGADIGCLFPGEGGIPILPLPGRAGTGDVRKQLRTPREFVAGRSDGRLIDAEVTISEVEGGSKRLYIAVIRDISEKKRIERQILHDAFHDKLTGLPNRALAMNRINHLLKRRDDQPGCRCAVLLVDLDRFKLVNDCMGHTAGDQLILEVSRRLMSAVRPADTVARLGGDEFAVVIEDVHDLRNAVHLAERIHSALEPEVVVRGTDVKASASIGIALSQEGSGDAEDLLRHADIAMYRAKEKGRARYEVFDIEMHSQTVMMMRIETDLRRAIGTEEIVVFYQPVVDLHKRVVAGYEALVRWMQPGRGMVSPADFIPVAEETGLICALGRQVLHAACRQNRQWMDQFGEPTIISVNLSAYQLQREDVVSMVRDVLRDTGLPTSALKLELTESVFVDYSKGDLQALDELKAMGIGISIDDFGTGYSSFSYLGKLPVEAIKLDRSFISGLPHDKDHVAISTSILALAEAMNLRVIAEGIEHSGQLKFLHDHGCRWAQGYLFGRPVPAPQAEELLFASIDVKL